MKKARILYLLKYLYQHSDEYNPVSSKEIREYLTAQGFEIHRTTISSDIASLSEFGIDVVTIRSSPNRYFIGVRALEPHELKMLVDAIISSKFITAKESKELIEKISKLTSEHHSKDYTEKSICIRFTNQPTKKSITPLIPYNKPFSKSPLSGLSILSIQQKKKDCISIMGTYTAYVHTLLFGAMITIM